MNCATCGRQIEFVRKAGGWLHAGPLAEFKVSRWETQDILRDPPRRGEPLHRPTIIHPALPGRRH